MESRHFFQDISARFHVLGLQCFFSKFYSLIGTLLRRLPMPDTRSLLSDKKPASTSEVAVLAQLLQRAGVEAL